MTAYNFYKKEKNNNRKKNRKENPKRLRSDKFYVDKALRIM